MICDDDESIVEMFELILGESGAELNTERNSTKLFDRLIKDKPDLLILDISMPGLTGDEILRHIRGDERLLSLPVIMVSADPDGYIKARQAGATSFYDKPFLIENFLKEVDQILHRNN